MHFRTLYCTVSSIGILQLNNTDEIIFIMKYDYMNKQIQYYYNYDNLNKGRPADVLFKCDEQC